MFFFKQYFQSTTKGKFCSFKNNYLKWPYSCHQFGMRGGRGIMENLWFFSSCCVSLLIRHWSSFNLKVKLFFFGGGGFVKEILSHSSFNKESLLKKLIFQQALSAQRVRLKTNKIIESIFFIFLPHTFIN